ncbi:MAG: hypothetical protein PHO93_02900 [Candidatus Saccharimonadaceae bacterium]|nr:hypothetical protein [Candidatus Saccharimonadaceae bacterium]
MMGTIVEDLTLYRYRVAPDGAIAETIDGLSVLKSVLTVGQKVKIIQIGDGETSAEEYGFCPVTSNLTGVVAVPENLRAQTIEQSPASFMAAFIANAANKFRRFYDLGKVLQVYAGQNLEIEYLTGENVGKQAALEVIDVDAGDFVVDEIALIDRVQFAYDAVVGWWEILGKFTLELVWDIKDEHPGTLIYVLRIAANDIETAANATYTEEYDAGSVIEIKTSTEFQMIYPYLVESNRYASGKSFLNSKIAAYYKFLGWLGDVASTENPFNLSLTADTGVVATFRAYYALILNMEWPVIYPPFYPDEHITVNGVLSRNYSGTSEGFLDSPDPLDPLQIQKFFEKNTTIELDMLDLNTAFCWWERTEEDGTITKIYDKKHIFSIDFRKEYKLIATTPSSLYIPLYPKVWISGSSLGFDGEYTWDSDLFEWINGSKRIYRHSLGGFMSWCVGEGSDAPKYSEDPLVGQFSEHYITNTMRTTVFPYEEFITINRTDPTL